MKDLGDPNKFVEWCSSVKLVIQEEDLIHNLSLAWVRSTVMMLRLRAATWLYMFPSTALHHSSCGYSATVQCTSPWEKETLSSSKSLWKPLMPNVSSQYMHSSSLSLLSTSRCLMERMPQCGKLFQGNVLCPPAFFCTWGYLPILCCLAAASHQDFADLDGSKLTLLSDRMYKNWVCRNKSYGLNELDALSFTLITKYTSLDNTFQWNGAQHKASVYCMTESIL